MIERTAEGWTAAANESARSGGRVCLGGSEVIFTYTKPGGARCARRPQQDAFEV